MTRARILVVEDDRVVARDIGRQLARIGHEVVGVTAYGEDGIAMAAELAPDLVLMDIRLDGGGDGIEAARQIRQRCHIPVIYLTAYADDDTVHRASRTEPYGYLLKPFEESQLRTAIEMALYKHAAERRLRDSERRYAVTLSSIGDAVIATDEQVRVTFMNPVACSLTGWTVEDALGRPLAEVFRIIAEDTGEPVEDPASKVLRLGTVVGLANHTALVARDGRVIPIDDCGSPIVDDRGAVTGVVLVFRDMSLRREVEEAAALRALNERIDEAVRGSNIGVWVDEMPGGDHRAGRVYSWNMWEHLGFPPRARDDEEAVWSALMHPEDRGPTDAAILRYFRGETADFEMPLRMRHADGSYRWFLVRGAAARDAHGAIVRFAGTSVDITDRVRAEEALRASEQRFRTFVEHAADAFFLYDEQLTILDVNSQACTSLGYTADELIGRRPLDFNADLSAEGLEELHRRVADGELVSLTSHHRRKDGSQFPVEIRARTFREGGRTLLVSLVRDVTDRERVEEALRESEARFRGTFENAAVGVSHCDPTGRYIRVNQRYCDILGYPREDLAGRSFLDVTHPDDVTDSRERFDALMRGEIASYRQEKRCVRRDGNVVWTDITVALQRDTAGRPIHTIAVMDDITPRKRLEEQLRHASVIAEAANRAKDEFLANVSHEIRTPMNAILGLTELVLDTPLGADQRKLLKTVESAAASLLGIINDLLDFSKIEAGKLELDPAGLPLRAVLGDTLRALATRAHRKGLELVCNVHPEVPDALIGDAGRLRQVLVNLVGNAIKFTAEGEVVVQVELAPGEAPAHESVVWLRFAVRDTGIGVPREKQVAIFRAFEQEDTSTTRKYGGTGLGLTIAAQLIALMGGKLTVESEPGRGSTFAFAARFERQAHPPAEADAAPPVLLRDLRVLVVDDNVANRHILDSWLRGWRMDSTAVGDGMAAMDALWHGVACGRPHALVLIDARMPDTDGLTLAARVRERAELAATRIILLTSGDRTGDAARFRELRVEEQLLKPVLQDELLEAILRVLSVPGGERPAATASAAPRPADETAAAAQLPPGGLRVLVAEDNEFNQRVIHELLTRRGHEVELASDGEQAIRFLDRGSFDLLLLDLHMPERDGFQVIAAVRERERTTGDHLPVIALTARSRREDRERVLAAGMDDFVTKPLQAESLWAAIARVRATPGVAARPLLDARTLLAACGEDAAILERLCAVFKTCLPADMDAIAHALRDRDAPRLREAAHKLSATVGTFSTVAGQLASDLEDRAAGGELDAAAALVRELGGMTADLLALGGGLSLEGLRAAAG